MFILELKNSGGWPPLTNVNSSRPLISTRSVPQNNLLAEFSKSLDYEHAIPVDTHHGTKRPETSNQNTKYAQE